MTKDQIERARLIPVLDYVMCYEESLYKRIGKSYRLRTDDAFAVDDNGWYCHKKCTGSKTALDYLVEIKGYGLVQAVCMLLDEKPQERSGKAKAAPSSSKTNARATTAPNKKPAENNTPPPVTENEPPKPQTISLPIRNKDNNRIIAYLQSRGIDRDLILDCINRGVLYESRYYHNAVFLGKDERGKTRFAAMRSITARFMRDADGSDKRYGFVIPPKNPHSNEVAIYEAPIDCLSHQTLCEQRYIPPFDGWRLSLGGSSITALEHFLAQHPQIKHCIVCTDNDEVGERIAEHVAEMQGITSERSLPIHGNDWNNTLQDMKKAERTQGKVRSSTHRE